MDTDIDDECNEQHQQHAHILAAPLQPKHPVIPDPSPAPAINLPQPYPDTAGKAYSVPHSVAMVKDLKRRW